MIVGNAVSSTLEARVMGDCLLCRRGKKRNQHNERTHHDFSLKVMKNGI